MIFWGSERADGDCDTIVEPRSKSIRIAKSMTMMTTANAEFQQKEKGEEGKSLIHPLRTAARSVDLVSHHEPRSKILMQMSWFRSGRMTPSQTSSRSLIYEAPLQQNQRYATEQSEGKIEKLSGLKCDCRKLIAKYKNGSCSFRTVCKNSISPCKGILMV